jgi:hypothetical protein
VEVSVGSVASSLFSLSSFSDLLNNGGSRKLLVGISTSQKNVLKANKNTSKRL